MGEYDNEELSKIVAELNRVSPGVEHMAIPVEEYDAWIMQ